jgi:hypothetical protein
MNHSFQVIYRIAHDQEEELRKDANRSHTERVFARRPGMRAWLVATLGVLAARLRPNTVLPDHRPPVTGTDYRLPRA